MKLFEEIKFIIFIHKQFKTITMKNWKTTLLGILSGVCLYGADLFPQFATILQPLSAVFLAGVGMVAKDNNVTGGTVDQTKK